MTNDVLENKFMLLTNTLKDKLKHNPIYKRSLTKIPDLSYVDKKGMLLVLNCIIVRYDRDLDVWDLDFPDIRVEEIFSRSDSQLGCIDYLNEVLVIHKTFVDAIKEIMPTSLVEGFLRYSVRKLLLVFCLYEGLKKETHYRIYIDENGVVLIDDLNLHIVLTHLHKENIEITTKTNGDYMYISAVSIDGDNAEEISVSLFKKYKILQTIRSYILQSVYTKKTESDFCFKRYFNQKIDRTIFDYQEKLLNIDYYSELIRSNPSVDIKEIYYLAARLRRGGTGLKTLSGYYVLDFDTKTFEHFTSEEFEKKYYRHIL